MKSHDKLAAERFDTWAETYGDDRISAWFSYFQDQGLSRLDLEGGQGFLDVGCGPGLAVAKAASRLTAGQACGIDVSPGMVERAKQKSAHLPNVEFRVGSSEEIPYPDGSFHSILCSFSFHHYSRPDKALQEIYRVLSPAGTFVLIDSARDVSLAIWLQDRWRRYLEKSHVRYYTSRELLKMLEGAGFVIQGDMERFTGMFHKGKVFTGAVLATCVKKTRS